MKHSVARFWVVSCALFAAIAVNAADLPDASGTWQLTVQDTGRVFTPSFKLTQHGEQLKGTYRNSQGDNPASGTIKGHEVTLNAQITGSDGNKRTVTYAGTIAGDTITGRLLTDRAEVTFIAKQIPSSDCDRACLKQVTLQYLHALVQQDPRAAPLAPGIRYTENAVDTQPGSGLWQTAVELGEFQRIYVDAVQGQTAFFGLVNEQEAPAIVSLRLRVVDRRVTEAEAIIGRKGVSLYEPQSLVSHGPADAPIPVGLRTPRGEMIRAADSYFDGAQSQAPGIVLQRPGCDRFENGVKMTHREGPGAGGVSMSGDCAASIANATQIAAVVNRRYPVVDEEAGVIVGTAVFNRPPGARRRDGTLWPRLLLTEFFPVEQGRLTAIHAVMFYLPPEAKDSGWK
jgi:hypothetical protein